MVDATTATVEERKFNGCATYRVQAESAKIAREAAKRFWRNESTPIPQKLSLKKTEMRTTSW